MTGRWSGNSATDRKDELPDDWDAIRQEVFDRDGRRCTWILPSGKRCENGPHTADHIGSKWDNSLPNLRTLCEPHNSKRTASQGAEEAARQRATPPRRKRQKKPSDGWR